MPSGYYTPESIAGHAAAIATWWASNPARQPHYTPKELEHALGCGMRALAAPLELICGWRRVRIWSRRNNKRALRVYWVPPGGNITLPARGRPRFDMML